LQSDVGDIVGTPLIRLATNNLAVVSVGFRAHWSRSAR
jgi:hypothetical protein